MKLTESVKPISFLKSNTTEVIRSVNDSLKPIVITQSGKARAVIQDVASYEQTLETMTLLKMVVQSKANIDKTRSFRAAIKDLRLDLSRKAV